MAEIWGTVAVVGAAVIGAGATVYGSSTQRVANNKAMDANAAAQDKQNDSAWSGYLMSRGMAPTVPLTPGVLPQAGQYNVVNQKLPIWMTLNQPPASAPKKGGFLRPRAAA